MPAAGHFYALPFVRDSYLFVDFFFVLSGFVITHSYMEKLHDAQHGGDFFLRRFGRLWPLHASVLFAFVLLEVAKLALLRAHALHSPQVPFSGPYAPNGIVTSLLLVQAFGPHAAPVWNAPSWSISAEFYTYLLFAGLCLAASRNGEPKGRRRRISFFAALFALAGALIVSTFSARGMDITDGLSFFRCIEGFFLGHLAYRVWQSKAFRMRAASTAEIAALALVIAFVTLAGYGAGSFLAPLVFAGVVLVFAEEAGPVSGLMKTGAAAWLGAWSYSIYLTHAFLFELALDLGKLLERRLGAHWLAMIPLHGTGTPTEVFIFHSAYAADLLALGFLAVVVGVAALTYRFIERPGQRFFNRLAQRHIAPGRTRIIDITGFRA